MWSCSRVCDGFLRPWLCSGGASLVFADVRSLVVQVLCFADARLLETSADCFDACAACTAASRVCDDVHRVPLLVEYAIVHAFPQTYTL